VRNLPEFHARLLAWYQAHGRHDLPWRNTDDAYAIWVSEVMLQQTQVKTVLERFYFPFLKAFPNIRALAKADLQEVLQLWQGLGYYSRARNLHRTAQEMAAQKLNTLPAEPAALMKLPGIGRNTAHAIASFGFHQSVPVLEANVKRVVARIFALPQPNEKELWQKAESLLLTENPFDYNQAMMDVGALRCTPKNPNCGECPASLICKGKEAPESYPQKAAKKTVPTRHKNIVLLEDGKGRYAIRPRETRFLHGLWEFPETEGNHTKFQFNNQPYSLDKKYLIGEISHAYSHFMLQAEIYALKAKSGSKDWHWKTAKEIAALPLSRTEKKILALISQSKT